MKRSRPPEVEVAKVWIESVRPLRDEIPLPPEMPKDEVATQVVPLPVERRTLFEAPIEPVESKRPPDKES